MPLSAVANALEQEQGVGDPFDKLRDRLLGGLRDRSFDNLRNQICFLLNLDS